jgi:hypothetical protein
MIAFNGHVQSGSMMPQQARVDGLKWPTAKAEGVADWKTETAEAGQWFAGPKVSTRTIPENGDGSYESFIIDHEPSRCFDCCKTNYHPYDLAVQCCLIVLKEHFGTLVAIKSDGEPDEWKEAADVCQHVLGYGILFEVDRGEALVNQLNARWEVAAKAKADAERQQKYGSYPPAPTDRNDAIKRIRTALKKRTGRAWSVKGGRGTGWGWIKISAPPRRIFNWSMTEEDARILAEALGLDPRGSHCFSIPSGGDYYTEYVDRAEGREPRTHGKQYWD